jgi:hypothetical protein
MVNESAFLQVESWNVLLLSSTFHERVFDFPGMQGDMSSQQWTLVQAPPQLFLFFSAKSSGSFDHPKDQ